MKSLLQKIKNYWTLLKNDYKAYWEMENVRHAVWRGYDYETLKHLNKTYQLRFERYMLLHDKKKEEEKARLDTIEEKINQVTHLYYLHSFFRLNSHREESQ
ncbi:MAG: hypothetical protein AABX16_00865 [Nanoarchaeota archaeon]